MTSTQKETALSFQFCLTDQLKVITQILEKDIWPIYFQPTDQLDSITSQRHLMQWLLLRDKNGEEACTQWYVTDRRRRSEKNDETDLILPLRRWTLQFTTPTHLSSLQLDQFCETYTHIWAFLCHVAKAKHHLVHLHQLYLKSKGNGSDPFWFCLTSKMTHFLHALERYLVDITLSREENKFKMTLKKVGHVADFISAHASFLNRLSDRFLLTSTTRPLLLTLVDLLNTCTQISQPKHREETKALEKYWQQQYDFFMQALEYAISDNDYHYETRIPFFFILSPH